MEEPIAVPLHINRVLSDADCQLIHELLVGPPKEATKIAVGTHRLPALGGQLTQLTEKHSLEDITDVSPIHKLPEDSVAEIFAACLPSDRNAFINVAEAPLLLCRI
ncbi:hypothetical protein DFH06DRAFT_507666 [Mycena polygramma]|nr:hypothetical protein DFH06DRAFT_507666 [Mycena polygramma]